MKSLGIDIGSTAVRIAEVTGTSKGVSVTQFYEHKFSQKPGQDKDIEIIEFLRSTCAHYDKTTTLFNFALRQDKVSVHRKVFPFNDRIKIHKSLPFELEDEIPFDSDDVIFDAKIIKYEGNSTEVLACAVPKHHIEKIVQIAKDSGIEPTLITSEGIAFANLFENWNGDVIHLPTPPPQLDEESKTEISVNIVLYLGNTQTLLCAFEGSALIAAKSLHWGAAQIIEAVSKKYEIPVPDAKKEVESKGFVLLKKQGASFDQVTFSDIISKNLRDLSKDIQLALLDIKSEFNARINEVSLSGGPSKIKNIQALLTQMLELPVNRVSLLNQVPGLAPSADEKTENTMGVALGLALEGLRKPRNPAVNFLRGEFALENKFFKALVDRWGKTAQFVAAILVISFIYSSIRETTTLQLAEMSEEALKTQAIATARLPKKQANEANIKKFIKNNQKRLNELRNVAKVSQMNSAMDILKLINDSSPLKENIILDMKSFEVDDTNVKIEGYVNSAKELSNLQIALKAAAMDGKITETPSKLPLVGSKKAFAMNFKVNRGIEKAAVE